MDVNIQNLRTKLLIFHSKFLFQNSKCNFTSLAYWSNLCNKRLGTSLVKAKKSFNPGREGTLSCL